MSVGVAIKDIHLDLSLVLEAISGLDSWTRPSILSLGAGTARLGLSRLTYGPQSRSYRHAALDQLAARPGLGLGAEVTAASMGFHRYVYSWFIASNASLKSRIIADAPRSADTRYGRLQRSMFGHVGRGRSAHRAWVVLETRVQVEWADRLCLVSFDPSSSGQVALVMYEWSDVPYLGVDTPEGSVGSLSPPVGTCPPLMGRGADGGVENVHLYRLCK